MEPILEALTLLTKQGNEEQKQLLESLVLQLKQNNSLVPTVEALLLQSKNDNAKTLEALGGLASSLSGGDEEKGETIIIKRLKGDKGDDYVMTEDDFEDIVDRSVPLVERNITPQLTKLNDKVGKFDEIVDKAVNNVLKSLPKDGKDFISPATVKKLVLECIEQNRQEIPVDQIVGLALQQVSEMNHVSRETFEEGVAKLASQMSEVSKKTSGPSIAQALKDNGIDLGELKTIDSRIGKLRGHNHYLHQLENVSTENRGGDKLFLKYNPETDKYEHAEGGSSLVVKENDGNPTVDNVTEIRFTNGTVTDEGNGVISVVVGVDGDNLGDHTATENLQMENNDIENAALVEAEELDVGSGGISNGGDLDMNQNDIEDCGSIEMTTGHSSGHLVACDSSVDWREGNFQQLTLTTPITFTFTAPSGPATLILRMRQPTGGANITWPATVVWPDDGTEPTWSTGNGEFDLVSFFYDGSKYYGMAGLNFAS